MNASLLNHNKLSQSVQTLQPKTSTETTPVIKEKTGRSLSLNKKIQRSILLSLAKVTPSVAHKLAWHHFIHPRKTKAYSLQDLPENAVALSLQHRNKPLKGYSWGDSEKRVYLVHGWESNVSKLKHFVSPLVKLGFQVIAFDLPAHGESKHKNTHFKDCVNALEHVVKTYGKPHSIIAHSGGAAMTVNMLSQNPQLNPEKLSLISPMLSAQTHVDVFSSVAGLPESLKTKLGNTLEQSLSMNLEDTSITKLIKTIKADGLVCHDRDDSYIPYSYGEAIASAWQGAKLYSSHQLGHRRILRNKAIISKVIEHSILSS